MKAMLEIELPKSCAGCPLCQGQNGFMVCVGTDKSWITGMYKVLPAFSEGFDKWKQRAAFCPLEIAPSCADADKFTDGTCIDYQKSETDDEPADMCMECKQSQFYEEATNE